MLRHPLLAHSVTLSLALLASACTKDPDVVVYVSLDQVFSEEIIDLFEERTGLTVDAVYDTEASKTVGHVGAIRAEQDRPRCDVFWNNEIAQTIALQREGLLQPYDSPSAATIPEEWRDPERYWTGFAARARILMVNTDKVEREEITTMWDLVDPAWGNQAVIAKPLTGTTVTHAAALYSVLGEEEAERYLTGIVESNDEGGVNIAASNGQTMRMVRDGDVSFGWTDTDDFNVALEQDYTNVVAVYPDQGEGQPGTMVIPNTVAMIAGAPHPDGAKRLIDFLLSEEVEGLLAESRSVQIPVRDSVPRPAKVRGLDEFRVMEVDWAVVVADLVAHEAHFLELFQD